MGHTVLKLLWRGAKRVADTRIGKFNALVVVSCVVILVVFLVVIL